MAREAFQEGLGNGPNIYKDQTLNVVFTGV